MIVTLVLAAAMIVDADQPGRPASGRVLVERNCGACHATGSRDVSRRRAAPALRDLHKRYPIENLEEALGEGILVGHADMPSATFTADEVADIEAYLKSLNGRSAGLRRNP